MNKEMIEEKISYAAALEEIEETLKEIEQDNSDIDSLSERVKRVAYLIEFCRSRLRSTEQEVNQILKNMEEQGIKEPSS